MTRTKGRAKARPSSRLLVGVVALLALAFAGCRSPLDDGPAASAERTPELGEPATRLPNADEPATTTTATPASDQSAPTTTGRAQSGSTTTIATSAPATASPGSGVERDRQLASITDAGGTSGSAPSYADVRNIAFADTGERLRVTVDVAAPFPAFKEREVLGIGVDIFRTDGRESDYQLFADGGTNGWRAYLQTPEGFIEYPGSFAVGTARLQFEVPWSSVGGRRSFRTSTFVDWSSRDTLLPQAGNDYAPDSGTADVNV